MFNKLSLLKLTDTSLCFSAIFTNGLTVGFPVKRIFFKNDHYGKKNPHRVANFLINPIALRKAKIVYNFGLSECNRVKELAKKE